jgi:hypothetical protein
MIRLVKSLKTRSFIISSYSPNYYSEEEEMGGKRKIHGGNRRCIF